MSSIGIDFGTSNSAVATFSEKDQRITSSEYEGTLLYFEESNEQIYHTGNVAIAHYLANEMTGRFIKSIKSVLPSSVFTFTYIFGKKYYAEDLVALILLNLKKKGEALAGSTIDKVVIGRPAKFSLDPAKDKLAQDRLLDWGKG